jgi:nitrite reductase (NADH) large subunit
VADKIYALDNLDPFSGANVLARGIVGDVSGQLVVASPVYKQHFALGTGCCLEDPEVTVGIYPAGSADGRVWVQAPALSQAIAVPRLQLVVIGNGMAGMRTVEELLALAPERFDITVFGAEPHGNYNRVLLSPVLSGEKHVDDIMLHTPEWYAAHGVTLHAGDACVAIDRGERIVSSSLGREKRYDRLLLATGSRPVMLDVPGAELQGIVSFRDLRDVNSMLAAAERYRHAVVIGGGLLGLEAANGLQRRGMQVTVLHRADRLMERQLDSMAARLLEAELVSRGIRIRVLANTTAILGEERVRAVRLETGEEIPADLLVVAAGIRPNIDVARAAGLRCGRGVLVDDTLQSFDASIYAVGECAEHRQAVYGLVAPLWEQARVCAAHLAGVGVLRYGGSLPAAQLKVSGIDAYSAGDVSESPFNTRRL